MGDDETVPDLIPTGPAAGQGSDEDPAVGELSQQAIGLGSGGFDHEGPTVMDQSGNRSRLGDDLLGGPEAATAARDPSAQAPGTEVGADRKSTRLNSSHVAISYAVFCLKKKNKRDTTTEYSQPATED